MSYKLIENKQRKLFHLFSTQSWWGSAYLLSHGMGKERILLFSGNEELGFLEYILKCFIL